MRRSVVDGRCRSKRAVMTRLARDLGFPSGPPANIDALFDVLRTDVRGPIEIEWRPTPRARAALGADADRLLQVLRDVAAQRADVTLRVDG